MKEKTFQKEILDRLESDDVSALEAFWSFHDSNMDLHEKIEKTHEFIDMLTFKLKQSRSKMEKPVLAEFLFRLFKKTIKIYEYNQKFLASQFKALVTYYKNQKDFDNAIIILEFLILNGIADDDAQRFHVQLDEMYKLRIKNRQKLNNGQARGEQ